MVRGLRIGRIGLPDLQRPFVWTYNKVRDLFDSMMYIDRDAKEIDFIMEGDGKLCPLEIKKTATPDKRITRTFGVIDKAPLQLGTGALLCMAEQFGAFDINNLIVPIWAT